MISLSILFANDDVLTQWVMTEVLEDAGFAVTSACRASEVADLLADSPEFDILIADATVVGSAGKFDIGHIWRQTSPGKPVIYTGLSRKAVAQPLQFHDRFLKAPFTPKVLLRAIDEALEDASFPSIIPTFASGIHHVH